MQLLLEMGINPTVVFITMAIFVFMILCSILARLVFTPIKKNRLLRKEIEELKLENAQLKKEREHWMS